MTEFTKVMSVPILPGLKGTGEHDHCPASANHGLPGAWWGIHVEDPTKSTMFVNYETPDAYAAFQRSATCCPELQKAVSVPHEATFDAILSPPAGKVLGAAPIIEVAKLQLKAGVTREAWLAQMVLMQKLLDAIDACKGYAAGFVEGNDDYLILVGWDTVESHTEWMKGEKATPGSPVHDFGAMIETSEMHHIAIREVMPGASRH